MARVVVIIFRGEDRAGIVQGLPETDIRVEAVSLTDAAEDAVQGVNPDAVLVSLRGLQEETPEIRRLLTRLRQVTDEPVIALISEASATYYPTEMGFDDFLVLPPRTGELAARIRQAVWRKRNLDAGSLLKLGDLLIDLERYHVSVAGRSVMLTFKEFELLRFLAANRGKVFSREALLQRVWGYDYYGGDRTVDVHIRRLRAKLEDKDHTFFETIRNVGYRFKEQPSSAETKT